MDINYSKKPCPAGLCPVCWHRHGKSISDLSCDVHTPDERVAVRELEKRRD